MYSSAYVWAKVLTHMENLLSTTVISTWFDDAEVVELTENKLVLYSPSEFRKNIIETRCVGHIQDAMKELFDMNVEVQVLSGEEVEAYKQKGRTPQFIEYNPQFTFDRFVVGPSNRFAHAAAIAVANRPAETYNPLFIYGPSGLGKTHLLYAIAGEINYRHPDYNIIYIKGDQFTNELIQALQEGKNAEFRNKYRNADLFLVDDIQFISGKESTQEEFFHTFNNLYENHKQIVLTSDRPPSDLLRLEDRLKTRFEWGLIADINPPDYETRMAIIRNKSDSLGMDMPDDVCSYIAENITTNIRQIEGTVKKIEILSTTLATFDNKEVVIPNSMITSDVVVNFTRSGTRRLDLSYGVSYQADLQKAKQLLQDLVDADERVFQEPAPLIAVGELKDSSVTLVCKVWCNADDYWPIYYKMQEDVKATFDREGISIPYPQLDVHMKPEK